MELEEALELLVAHTQRRLRDLPARQLRSAHAQGLYHLLDRLARDRRALVAGANPNRDVMLDRLLSELAVVG